MQILVTPISLQYSLAEVVGSLLLGYLLYLMRVCKVFLRCGDRRVGPYHRTRSSPLRAKRVLLEPGTLHRYLAGRASVGATPFVFTADFLVKQTHGRPYGRTSECIRGPRDHRINRGPTRRHRRWECHHPSRQPGKGHRPPLRRRGVIGHRASDSRAQGGTEWRNRIQPDVDANV